jgi:CRP/FNR family cyclic AMP-dependent transcriptional regulator
MWRVAFDVAAGELQDHRRRFTELTTLAGPTGVAGAPPPGDDDSEHDAANGDTTMRTRDERIKALGAVPLLSGLSKRDLGRILAIGKEVEFRTGREIVRAGDQGRDFYLLILGTAELHVPGRRREPLGPGDYFGEIAVLGGGPRSATITATSPVTALRIDRSAFIPLLDTYGSIARKILVVTVQRLRALERSSARH